ncbi:MAG: hypothetical protein GY765_33470 [bacterium]|nr:hypothetical protein [bacterium]
MLYEPPMLPQYVFPNTGQNLDGFVFGYYSYVMEKKQAGRFDKDGCFKPLNKEKLATLLEKVNSLVALKCEAVGTSAEGKEVRCVEKAFYMPGNNITGIKVPLTNAGGKAVKIRLAVINGNGRLVTAKADVTISRESLGKNAAAEKVLVWKKKTFRGRDRIDFNAEKEGRYHITMVTYDGRGKTVTTRTSFYIRKDGEKESGNFSMHLDKPGYKEGEKAELTIFSPKQGKALITVERFNILEHFRVPLEAGSRQTLQLEVKKGYFPGVTVRALVVYGKTALFEKSLNLKVKNGSKQLQVTIDTGKGEYLPASSNRIGLEVKDGRGKGVKAKLFVYCTDEGSLALTGYRTPDVYDSFYYREWAWNNRNYRVPTRYSRNYGRRMHSFREPYLDIDPKRSWWGRVLSSTGIPIVGAAVTVFDEKGILIDRAVSSAHGYYRIPEKEEHVARLTVECEGYVTVCHITPGNSNYFHREFILVMMPLKDGEKPRTVYRYWDYEQFKPVDIHKKNRPPQFDDYQVDGVVMGVAGGVEGGVLGSLEISGGVIDGPGKPPVFRMNMQPVLFFETVETDEKGHAEISFKTSDMLSSYRVMAVAYNEDSFGDAQKRVMVSKKLFLDESMPEYAYKGDSFRAGALVSNRSPKNVAVTFKTEAHPLSITGPAKRNLNIPGRGNRTVLFDFFAPETGEARVAFSARSRVESDGLIKKIPVYDNRMFESSLIMDMGKTIRKSPAIDANMEAPRLKLKVSSSPGLLTGKLCRVLLQYPYGCMEQRTSKVMPMLILDEALAKRLELNMSPEQIKKSVYAYLEAAKEFVTPQGAMAYYRGGRGSEYLTLYVLRAFELAEKRGFAVNASLKKSLVNYLDSTVLSKDNQCIFQYVAEGSGKADKKILKALFSERADLSLVGRVYLYKAIHRKLRDREKTRVLFNEFREHLDVETDRPNTHMFERIPRLDAQLWETELPFYGNRYIVALLLKAVLEVEGKYTGTVKILQWLLKCPSGSWNTTQTNYRVLQALSLYLGRDLPTYANIRVGDETFTKKFKAGGPAGSDSAGDSFTLEKIVNSDAGAVDIRVDSDQPVYMECEISGRLRRSVSRSDGIEVKRAIYDRAGKPVRKCRRGEFYKVEVLVDCTKEVLYGVIDVPLPAGFEVVRKDYKTARQVAPFVPTAPDAYRTPWVREEHGRERTVFYTYRLPLKMKVDIIVKALYKGSFTWFPTEVRGMYQPTSFGRTGSRRITIE